MLRETIERHLAVVSLLLCLLYPVSICLAQTGSFRIEVKDRELGWVVPGVELRTTHGLTFVSDNAGVIAIDAPELMNQETWFHVHGHSYVVPKDGFGYQGVRLKPIAGKSTTIQVDRRSIAKRIGRLTGAGLFAESQKLGERLDWIESPIVGCDSVQLVNMGDRYLWNWGDTAIRSYPLGLFDMLGATTKGRPYETLVPPLEPRFEYFLTDEKSLKAMAPIPGSGPTWLTGYANLKDREGEEHIVATYRKIKPKLDVCEVGLCEWNAQKEVFEAVKKIWPMGTGKLDSSKVPNGHFISWCDANGDSWMLFGDPFPTLRIPATYEAWKDIESHAEVLSPPTSLRGDHDEKVTPHSGSIAMHPDGKRWFAIFMEKHGKPSDFGELWFAESESPLGPWTNCIKILSHNNYTFYNPRIHGEWLADNPGVLMFEGTYTQDFADRPIPTPRFDYNQMLYRIDLDDQHLKSWREQCAENRQSP